MPQPRDPFANGKMEPIRIAAPQSVGVMLFDILWDYVYPSERKVRLATANEAPRLVQLADMYNVSAHVHKAYTIHLLQAEEQGTLAPH